MSCSENSANSRCTCSKSDCLTWSDCRLCVPKHRNRGEIPGCFFTPEGEKTYNRSIEFFIQDQQRKS